MSPISRMTDANTIDVIHNTMPATARLECVASHKPKPPPSPVPARLPAWYQPDASPFLFCFILFAMKPFVGNNVRVAATCDVKTINESNPAPFTVNGIKQSKSSKAVLADKPIQNHFFKLSDMSTTGPQKKRQRLAERPMATMPAVSATGNPFFVSRKGNATVTKPWLIPIGMTRKKI